MTGAKIDGLVKSGKKLEGANNEQAGLTPACYYCFQHRGNHTLFSCVQGVRGRVGNMMDQEGEF
jgi:hypothetical protein